MSGFFMIRRDAFMARVRKLSSLGFKILVDLFASGSEPLRFVEIPFRSARATPARASSTARSPGTSACCCSTRRSAAGCRHASCPFALIGGAGVGVHMAVLASLFKSGATDFTVGQAIATVVAMVFNFFVNNLLTYRDRRLRGSAMVRGLLTFMLVCSVGAVANVGIAEYLFSHRQGWVPAAIGGILVGAVWNSRRRRSIPGASGPPDPRPRHDAPATMTAARPPRSASTAPPAPATARSRSRPP
jgi:dolichol-phosphate mannosyltransferase